MTNEDLAKLIEHAKRVPVYSSDRLLVEVAEDLLKRRIDSQPKPVEAKEESTYERDLEKWCMDRSRDCLVCTRTKGHTGMHQAHHGYDRPVIKSWPNESPVSPKPDYGREKAEKIIREPGKMETAPDNYRPGGTEGHALNDYGKEKAEKMVATCSQERRMVAVTFGDLRWFVEIGAGMRGKVVDSLAAALNSARADGIRRRG